MRQQERWESTEGWNSRMGQDETEEGRAEGNSRRGQQKAAQVKMIN